MATTQRTTKAQAAAPAATPEQEAPKRKRFTGEVKLAELTPDEPPRRVRDAADLADYLKMLQVSHEHAESVENGAGQIVQYGAPYGVTVNTDAVPFVLSRFRAAAEELGLGVRLQVIDTDTEENKRIRFRTAPRKVRGVVTSRKGEPSPPPPVDVKARKR